MGVILLNDFGSLFGGVSRPFEILSLIEIGLDYSYYSYSDYYFFNLKFE